jgi:hypothetical protein
VVRLAVTISGGRPAQNNYRLDGCINDDYSNAPAGSVLGSNLGVDVVEEFSMLTRNYSAEYGRFLYILSGKRQLHASQYQSSGYPDHGQRTQTV